MISYIKKKYIVIILAIGFLFIGYWKRNAIKEYYCHYLFDKKYSKYPELNNQLIYRFYAPKTVENEKYPLVLYLHQWGPQGTDNRKHLNALVYEFAKPSWQRKNPCFIMAPQCPKGKEWVDKGYVKAPFHYYLQDEIDETTEVKMIMHEINKLSEMFPIDTNRVYITGYSMGGTAAWDIIGRYPNTFAAALISSGVGDITKCKTLINMGVWAFSGESDHISPPDLNKNMVDSILNYGGKAKYTLFEKMGHNIGYASFNHEGVKDWIFGFSKE